MGVQCSCLQTDRDLETKTMVISRDQSPIHKEKSCQDNDQFTLQVKDLNLDLKIDFSNVATSIGEIEEHHFEYFNEPLEDSEAPIVHLLEQELGQFKLDDSLHDGINVDSKPPVKVEDGIYQGEWDPTGHRHGRGVEVFEDGSKYVGYFNHDKMDHFGRLILANGDLYEGNFEHGLANGEGCYMLSNGAKYQGDFKEDVQHGHGKEEWPDGSIYEGNYVNGLKEGKGLWKWPDGSSYQGELVKNKLCGLGTYKWADGKCYSGQWKNDKMHGEGVFT